jgi:hypothetical protein
MDSMVDTPNLCNTGGNYNLAYAKIGALSATPEILEVPYPIEKQLILLFPSTTCTNSIIYTLY